MKFKTFYIIFLFICAALVGAGLGFAKIYMDRQKGYTVHLSSNDTFASVNAKLLNYLETSNNSTVQVAGSITFDDSILLNCYDATWKQFHCSDILSPMSAYLTRQGCLVGTVNGTFAGENLGRRNRPEFGYIGRKVYNAPDSFAGLLGGYGFNILAMANHNVYDSNYAGLVATKKAIVKNRMTACGIFPEKNDVCEYEEADLGGITAGVYSYTEGLNYKPQKGFEYSVNQIPSAPEGEAFQELCGAIKKNEHLGVDISVIYISFSNKKTGQVTPHQRQLVSLLFDAGADIIVGTNPDIIEPMELRVTKGKSGKKKYQAAFYSLGNFITGERGSVGRVTRNASILARFYYNQDNTGVYLSDMAFTPTYCVSYPTVNEEDDAGEYVRVYPVTEVYEYMNNNGSTKSTVKHTKPSVKKDSNGSSYQSTEALSEDTEESVTTEEATTEETTEQVSDTTQTPDVQTTELQVPDATTQPSPENMDNSVTGSSVNNHTKLWRWPSLFGVETVSALETEQPMNDDYVSHLTKSDFSAISGLYTNAIDRLFYQSGAEYKYKDGWFYLKK